MIGFIKKWMAERRARADRQRRFVAALEGILKNQGAALVDVMRRQEDLFEMQASLTKAVVSNFGSAENLAIELVRADPELCDSIIALAKQKLASVEPKRKALLDGVARMESKSDARLCQIEQFEKELASL